jgi:CheY-like chemotaxis protein
MAAGISRDFNLHLGAVAEACKTLMKGLKPDDPNLATLLTIERAVEKTGDLTRQLVAVGRQEEVERTELDLKPLILTMKRNLQFVVGKEIEIVTELETRPSRVRVDIGQMEKVILNLVLNARDALPRGGKITIETLDVDIPMSYARSNVGIEPGPYVLLSITHNGIGIDPSSWSRVFEPFSMASRPGKGRGMELATVYGIVKQSGGEIEVYSDVDLGSTFVVYLPRAEGGPVTSEHSPDPAAMPTVLLLEEERMIRALGRNILLMHGFNVLEATRLDEALTICRRHARPIQLMVTDVVMPEMMGRELAAQVAKLQPELRVLYTTGYTDSSMTSRSESSSSAFVEKPFPPGMFIHKVKDLLR